MIPFAIDHSRERTKSTVMRQIGSTWLAATKVFVWNVDYTDFLDATGLSILFLLTHEIVVVREISDCIEHAAY